jgi:hypothetical protein
MTFYHVKDIESQADLENAFRRKKWFKFQFDEVGTLIDMWADMLVDHADDGQTFALHLITHLKTHQGKNIEIKVDKLHTTGILADQREMLFVERANVIIAIYIAKQGKDLYTSWRAFLKLSEDWIKIVLSMLVLMVLGFFLREPVQIVMGYGTRTLPDLEALVVVIVTMIVSAIPIFLLFLWGYYRRDGDMFAFYRRPITEFHIDDILSMTNYVHNGVIAAADAIGVEEAQLEVREPLFKKRRRPRI